LSIDLSLRHGAFIIWKNKKPIGLMVWEDKEQNDYYENCDKVLKDFLNFVNNVYLKTKDFNYIFIEKPLLGGPNQYIIVYLLSFIYMVSYSLYSYTKIKPIMLNQSKIKTFMVGSQPRSVNKKQLVEIKMLKKYPEVFENLPNKRKNVEGDIYKRKYKQHISDCADCLAIGEYGLNAVKDK